MVKTAIDTLRFAHRLKEAGLPGKQAEALAAAIGEEMTEHIATKADQLLLRADLQLLKWMIGFYLAFSAASLWRVIDLA